MDQFEDQLFFDRLSQYVSRRQIQLQAFWTSVRLCVSLDELIKMCNQLDGFEVTFEEIESLEQGYPDKLVSVRELKSRVHYWTQSNLDISDIVASKYSSTRPKQSSRTKGSDKVTTKNLTRSQVLNSNMGFKPRALASNRSRLQERKEKQRMLDLELHQKILHNKNEEEFELMIKIAQANQISTKLKKGSYLLCKNPKTKVLEITATRTSGEVENIVPKIFLREYLLLKQQSINAVTYEKEINEQDLKKCLIETMFISQQIQEQMSLLRAKGITSDQYRG